MIIELTMDSYLVTDIKHIRQCLYSNRHTAKQYLQAEDITVEVEALRAKVKELEAVNYSYYCMLRGDCIG